MFWEIFYNLCITNGTKPNVVCKELNLSNATSTHWKNGAIPKGDALIKIADYFDCSVDYLLGRQAKVGNSSPKFVNKATYKGTVNEVTDDYARQKNIIEIKKNDSVDVNVSDAALEYDKILNSLNDSDRKMLISQVRAIAGTFKKK